jgi:hypothetical protein
LAEGVRGVVIEVAGPASSEDAGADPASVELPVLVVGVDPANVGRGSLALLWAVPTGFLVAAVRGPGALGLEFEPDESSAEATPVALLTDAASPMPTAPTPNQCA